MRLALCLLLASSVIGCVYPRRSTSLSPVQRPDASASITAPEDVYQLTIVEAQVVPQRRGGLPWDDGGGGPDPFVRVFRGEEMIFETPVINDSNAPRWNASVPANVRVTSTVALRFEVWDRDDIGADPIGIYRNTGRPSAAVLDADARLALEGGNYLTVRFAGPRPHRGVGIEEYELRPDALVVMRVMPHSPAARAGLEPGDRIVRIGERSVSSMNGAEAASELSMAVSRHHTLGVIGADGRERSVDLDRGFVWVCM